MKRLTLPLQQIESVATALALVYDDCRILSEVSQDAAGFGVYELVPVGRTDGKRREEARTLISNEGLEHESVLRMLARIVNNTLGEQA